MAFPLKALLASGALLASVSAAAAATATATADLNVRSGPGTGYSVIDTLPAGETVHVIGCSGPWCEISMGASGSGFANATYLDIRGGGPGPAPSTVVIEEDAPDDISGLAIGGYWDSRPFYSYGGYYYWGGRWYGSRPGRPGWQGSWRRDYHRDRGWNERRDAWRQRDFDRRRDGDRGPDRGPGRPGPDRGGPD
ncbi:MAG: SH3 domain-containing protein, partial [Hansschlegelia sp.]